MSDARYKRATRRQPCAICGKPDWCSRTPDGRISFCARTNAGADRVSREGWGIFYNGAVSRFDFTPQPRREKSQTPQLASIEVRDFTYRKLIEVSTARSSLEILDHPQGLHSRKIFDVSTYGRLPGESSERNKLARQLTRLAAEKFPGPVSKRQFAHKGIPGFWIDGHSRVRLGSETDLTATLLLIPCLDRNGMIQACQLRTMGEFPNGYSRYFWLSSAGKQGGSSPGSPLHFEVFDTSIPRPLLVTEGALKAHTARSFFPDHDIVASSGVSCCHGEIVSAARYRSMEIAFDSDSLHNPQVARAIAKLVYLRREDEKTRGYQDKTSVLMWGQTAKGLDEALIDGLPIRAASVLEWFEHLTSECRSAVTSAFAPIGALRRDVVLEQSIHARKLRGRQVAKNEL